MSPQARRGRIYLALFTIALATIDLLIKSMLAVQGTLRASQIVGTLITLSTLWFLWRGSQFAYRLLVLCLALTAIVIVVSFHSVSGLIVAIGIGTVAVLGLALAAPATRCFIKYQASGNVV